MDANERQVGGFHYQSGFQHWDFVLTLNLPYLPAQVTRYVARWRKKNGIEDLNKALHYMDKMIATEKWNHEQTNRIVENFLRSNPMESSDERTVFNMLVNYGLGDTDRLIMARDAIRRLIVVTTARTATDAAKAQAEIDDLFSTKENLNAQ